MWQGEELRLAFSEKLWGRAVRLVRSGTHLHSFESLRQLLAGALPGPDFADLELPFQCVAASIEGASARWFSSGPVVPAVMASCAVPGLLPPVEIDGMPLLRRRPGRLDPGRAGGHARRQHGLRAAGGPDREPARGAHCARGRWGWWRSRSPGRHRFHEEMSSLPENVRVHVLPTGGDRLAPGLAQFRYRDQARVGLSIERAYAASASYLAELARN